MRRTLAAALLAGGLWAAPALAQEAPASAPTGSVEQVTSFQAASNEQMKYRHLWIAYGAIWLLIFGFVWRTWQRQRGTAVELEDLRRRLAAMEGRDGPAD
jgi:CcmD family protein